MIPWCSRVGVENKSTSVSSAVRVMLYSCTYGKQDNEAKAAKRDAGRRYLDILDILPHTTAPTETIDAGMEGIAEALGQAMCCFF